MITKKQLTNLINELETNKGRLELKIKPLIEDRVHYNNQKKHYQILSDKTENAIDYSEKDLAIVQSQLSLLYRMLSELNEENRDDDY